MIGKEPARNLGSRHLARFALVVALATSTVPVQAADSLWDSALETLNLKSTPAGSAPAFVEKTRPDPEGLSFLPPAVPHKVSPLAVKTAPEIKAKQDALDAAAARQLNPNAPKPLQVAKAKKPGKAQPASAGQD